MRKRRADHRDDQGRGSRDADGGSVSQARPQPRHEPSIQIEVCGVKVSDGAKLKALTDQNAKLKGLLADTIRDSIVLMDLLGKG